MAAHSPALRPPPTTSMGAATRTRSESPGPRTAWVASLVSGPQAQRHIPAGVHSGSMYDSHNDSISIPASLPRQDSNYNPAPSPAPASASAGAILVTSAAERESTYGSSVQTQPHLGRSGVQGSPVIGSPVRQTRQLHASSQVLVASNPGSIVLPVAGHGGSIRIPVGAMSSRATYSNRGYQVLQ
eukprot:TRINITY_DN80118_c0_g1_i1.p1 TRINITY_DN80118_c0_g1~~TRINITY_DN80118_c0_g1_i1.p1  ORF type:complete len:195 (+),score=13.82 TRINITY_DN80118_c0_g1_i1:31-585(+)